MTKLSVVIITFNEEKNIGRCIESVRDIADEIVVVDSFSTDRTKDICLSYGVDFHEHKFEGYIAQKNYAISRAAYPHQLSLDADEALSDELKKAITEIKNNWIYDAYTMKRLTNYCGKWIRHSGWYPDIKQRLYNSEKGRWTGQDPHDKFVMNPGANIRHINHDILHFSYYSIDEHILQSDKFSSIAAHELVRKGQKILFYKILLNPIAKFLRNYFLKLGFLDGYFGFLICQITANETFLKYVKARQLLKSARKK